MSIITHALIFLSICFLVYWFFIPAKWRSAFLFGASAYFMSLFSIKYTLYFVFNAVLVYFAGVLISKEVKNKALILKLTIVWLIGSLCAFKYTNIILDSIFKMGSQFTGMQETAFTKIALPLGLSYIIFRLIHYIVEIYRKTFPKHKFWDLASYVFFFPTFLAGPVERFQKFHHQTEEKKSLDPSDINYGLFRIISGLIKKFVIADSLKPLVMPILISPQESAQMYVVLAVYGLAIRIYMDFSGYTDMALGVARLFGYKIVENFNNPFFKKNIAMFWRSWHMSVYSFIRDYFYFPFFAYRATQLKIYVGIFVTITVFMLWHNLTLSFLIAGIIQGSALVLWQLFQELKGKHRRIRKLVDNPYSDVVSTALTFTFVSVTISVLYFDIYAIKNIIYRIL